jgi:hypothetical protein
MKMGAFENGGEFYAFWLGFDSESQPAANKRWLTHKELPTVRIVSLIKGLHPQHFGIFKSRC